MFAKLVPVILLAILIPLAYRLIVRLDVNKRVYNHKPGECRTVEGVRHGSEDIELIRPLNIAFVTSGVAIDHRPGVKGQIFIYDFNQPKGKHVAEPVKIVGKDFKPDLFFPHGLSSILIDGKPRLFVISHAPGRIHSVEIFDYDVKTKTLNHIRRVKDVNFVSPNDIAAVGPDSFIISNDGSGASTSLLVIGEFILGLPTGSVYFYDGQKSYELLRGTTGSNGLWYNIQKKLLFVAMFTGESLSVYKFDEKAETVQLINDLPLLTGIDNLYEDEEGALWTGAHPVLKDAIDHFRTPDDPKFYGPSQVLRIKFSPDYQRAEVVEVYADDGRELSASAAAVYHKKQLLVGSVMRTLLHCDVVNNF